MLAAAGVTAWSLIVLMLPSAERERVVGFFTATAVVGAGVLLAAGGRIALAATDTDHRLRR